MPYSIERGRQFYRQMAVLQVLENSRFGLTKTELHRQVQSQLGQEFSMRSLERDIEFLQLAGFPVDKHPGPDLERSAIWKLQQNDRIHILKPGDNQALNMAEMLALEASFQGPAASVSGTPFSDGMKSVWKKIKQAIPNSILRRFESERPNWLVRGTCQKNYTKKTGMISAINRSIKMKTMIELKYQKASEETATLRRLQPYLLVVGSSQLMLVAVEPADDPAKFKHFKLDRIVAVNQLVNHRFKRRPDFDRETYFKHSVGLYHGSDAAAATFRIRFAPSRAEWVKETPFQNSKQIVDQEADGSLVLETTGYAEEILPRLLGHGDQVEILSPPSARDWMRSMAASLADMYGPGQKEIQ